MISVVLDVHSTAAVPLVLTGTLPAAHWSYASKTWVPNQIQLTLALSNHWPVLGLMAQDNLSPQDPLFTAEITRREFGGWEFLLHLFHTRQHLWHSLTEGGAWQPQRITAQLAPFDNTWLIDATKEGGRLSLTEQDARIWCQDLGLVLRLARDIESYVHKRRTDEALDLLTDINNLIVVSLL